MGIKHFKFLWIPCSYGWCQVYTGMGFRQGIGFNLMKKILKIGKHQFVLDIKFDVESEWLENLKLKLKD